MGGGRNKTSPNHFGRNAAQLGDFNHYQIKIQKGAL